MKCPLLLISRQLEDKRGKCQATECGEEYCALWDKILKQCVAMSMLQAIRNKAVK